jgi:hypothetical protein
MSLFCGPKNSMRSASFYRSTDAVHSSFPMRSGEKLPLRFDVFMVFLMVSQITEVKLVFILADSSQVSHIFHETFHEHFSPLHSLDAPRWK